MSESVRIGGIGKNPAIDKINSLNSMDVKNYAVNKMEQLLLTGDVSQTKTYMREVPIDFDKADWKGEIYGNKCGKVTMAGNKLPGGTDLFEASPKLEKGTGRNDNRKISIQFDSAGNFFGSGQGRDNHIQFAGKATAGRAGLSCNSEDADGNQSYLSGKYHGVIKKL